VRAGDNEWLFSVSDNGISIEAQYAEKVFGIFRSLKPHDKGAGTGMGLAICWKNRDAPRRPHLGGIRAGQRRHLLLYLAAQYMIARGGQALSPAYY